MDKEMTENPKPLVPPFPWYGGKRRVAAEVWRRLGDVNKYIEPFFGGGAVLLGRPHDVSGKVEIIVDLDGYVVNFWRAVQADPKAVAKASEQPVHELTMQAWCRRLMEEREARTERLRADPDYYDPLIAGRWAWGLSAWIGHGWASSAHKSLPNLHHAGQGLSAIGTRGRISDVMESLQCRLRHVTVCCGDWSRVVARSATSCSGICGVFLDPPYSKGIRDGGLYAQDTDPASECLAWCIEHGSSERLRIALCGYDGEHNALEDAGWSVYAWKANGGYGNQGSGRGNENKRLERIWFSPACLPAEGESVEPMFEGIERG